MKNEKNYSRKGNHMKRIVSITLSLLLILAVFCSCAKMRDSSESVAESTSETTSSDSHVQENETISYEYYAPNYDSEDSLKSELFIDILERDGYYQNGEIFKNYNTNNISSVVNITPQSIADQTSGIDIFLVKDGYHCFLMKDQKIYRYDTFGGRHLQLCLWDYDKNGTKDLVSYDTFGSGIWYIGVRIFDFSSMEYFDIITRKMFSSDSFLFRIENGIIFINDEELTYTDGQFHFKNMVTYSDFVQTYIVDSEYRAWLLSVPEEIKSASTGEILEYFLKTPFMGQQIFSVSSTPMSERVDLSIHDAFRELVSREDCVDALEIYAGKILNGEIVDEFDIKKFEKLLDNSRVKSLVFNSGHDVSYYPNLESIYG